MSTLFTVTPPSSIGEAVLPLGRMPEAEFRSLLESVSGPRSFSLSKEKLDNLRKRTPSVAAGLTYLLGVLAFLFSQVDRVVELGESFDSAISQLVEEVKASTRGGDDYGLLRDRLAAILTRTDKHKRFRKIQRLQSGFIPNAVGFSSFVDLRPDYGDSEVLDLRGFIKVVQFRVNTDADNPDQRRVVFQLNEDTLGELKKAVDRASKKLALLKTENLAALPIIDL
jgi:hypothetical protein